MIVSGGDDGIIKLWNLETGEEVGQGKAHSKAAYAVAFSPRILPGKQAPYIASGGYGKDLHL